MLKPIVAFALFLCLSSETEASSRRFCGKNRKASDKNSYSCSPVECEDVIGFTPEDIFTHTAANSVASSQLLTRAFDITSPKLLTPAYLNSFKWLMGNASVPQPSKQSSIITQAFVDTRDRMTPIVHAKVVFGSLAAYLQNQGILNMHNAARLACDSISSILHLVCCVASNQDDEYFYAIAEGYKDILKDLKVLDKNFQSMTDLYATEAYTLTGIPRPFVNMSPSGGKP